MRAYLFTIDCCYNLTLIILIGFAPSSRTLDGFLLSSCCVITRTVPIVYILCPNGTSDQIGQIVWFIIVKTMAPVLSG